MSIQDGLVEVAGDRLVADATPGSPDLTEAEL